MEHDQDDWLHNPDSSDGVKVRAELTFPSYEPC